MVSREAIIIRKKIKWIMVTSFWPTGLIYTQKMSLYKHFNVKHLFSVNFGSRRGRWLFFPRISSYGTSPAGGNMEPLIGDTWILSSLRLKCERNGCSRFWTENICTFEHPLINWGYFVLNWVRWKNFLSWSSWMEHFL